MRLFLSTLFLTLFLPLNLAAENIYEYIHVRILEPKSCLSPCELSWSVQVPDDVVPLSAFVKQCPGGSVVTRDRFLTLYQSGANYPNGGITYTLGDNFVDKDGVGRVQVYCLRFQGLKYRD